MWVDSALAGYECFRQPKIDTPTRPHRSWQVGRLLRQLAIYCPMPELGEPSPQRQQQHEFRQWRKYIVNSSIRATSFGPHAQARIVSHHKAATRLFPINSFYDGDYAPLYPLLLQAGSVGNRQMLRPPRQAAADRLSVDRGVEKPVERARPRPLATSGKCLFKVSDQVANILEPHGNANQVRRQPHAQLGIARHGSVRHRTGMLNEGFHSSQ